MRHVLLSFSRTVALIVCLTSIADSLITPAQQRCAGCHCAMPHECTLELKTADLQIFRCGHCLKGRTRIDWHDGRIEWLE